VTASRVSGLLRSAGQAHRLALCHARHGARVL